MATVGSAAAAHKAEVYASYWGQPTNEQTCAADLTETIKTYFESAGYTASKYENINSASTVYTNIQSDQTNYDRVAVFHFGHMTGPGNYYCSDGSNVSYPVVYSNTAGYADKHSFV
jgi:hypothetical protein